MKVTFTIMTLTAITLSACAQTPSAIQPIPMGNVYSDVSCAKARSLYAAEQQKLPALIEAQNGAVAADAVGVLLVGVPVSSLVGGDKAGDIGATKGKMLALEARLASC